jgi:hypothetical protein
MEIFNAKTVPSHRVDQNSIQQQTDDKKFSLHETIRLDVLKRDKRVVVVALFLTNDQQLT